MMLDYKKTNKCNDQGSYTENDIHFHSSSHTRFRIFLAKESARDGFYYRGIGRIAGFPTNHNNDIWCPHSISGS